MTDQETQRKLDALPAFQREQIATHVAGYRMQLLSQQPPMDAVSAENLVNQFHSTLVTQIYKRFAPAPSFTAPPKPHPLSVKASPYQPPAEYPSIPAPPPPPPPARPSVPTMEVLVGGMSRSIPIILKDWIVRLYSGIPFADGDLRARADGYIEDLVVKAIHSGAIMTTDWRFFPVPTVNELRAWKCPRPVIQPKPKKEVKKSEDFIPISKPKKDKTPPSSADPEEIRRRNERAAKYKDHLENGLNTKNDVFVKADVQYEFGDDTEEVFDKSGKFVGTCKNLEKSYFRLTSAPDPALVRPESVLQRHLIDLKLAYEKKSRDYKWISDQIRAVRQDLTVQGLQNSFACSVYEWHGRIALENDDLGQFNQCQTQLKELHKTVGSNVLVRAEYLSYALIYFVLQDLRVDQQKFLKALTHLPEKLKNHTFISFALKVRESHSTGNFSKFFQLFKAAASLHEDIPAHALFLMKGFIDRMRLVALGKVCKAFPTSNVKWLSGLLGFDSDGQAIEFLQKHVIPLKQDTIIDSKTALQVLADHPLLASRKHALMG